MGLLDFLKPKWKHPDYNVRIIGVYNLGTKIFKTMTRCVKAGLSISQNHSIQKKIITLEFIVNHDPNPEVAQVAAKILHDIKKEL